MILRLIWPRNNGQTRGSEPTNQEDRWLRVCNDEKLRELIIFNLFERLPELPKTPQVKDRWSSVQKRRKTNSKLLKETITDWVSETTIKEPFLESRICGNEKLLNCARMRARLKWRQLQLWSDRHMAYGPEWPQTNDHDDFGKTSPSTQNYWTVHRARNNQSSNVRDDVKLLYHARMRERPQWRKTTNISSCSAWSETT